jgi:hypothetical protein
LPKVVNYSKAIKTALVTTFNVTCNCKLMRAVKEENSPNYNLKVRRNICGRFKGRVPQVKDLCFTG